MKSDSSARINKIQVHQNGTLKIKVINGDAKTVNRVSHAVDLVARTLPPLETTLPAGHVILRYLHPTLFIRTATYKLFLEAGTRRVENGLRACLKTACQCGFQIIHKHRRRVN